MRAATKTKKQKTKYCNSCNVHFALTGTCFTFYTFFFLVLLLNYFTHRLINKHPKVRLTIFFRCYKVNGLSVPT